MLDYVAKLTLRPAEMTRQDVEALRTHGFDDEQILNIAQVAGLFSYLNRLADGLGITLEKDSEEMALELGLPTRRFPGVADVG